MTSGVAARIPLGLRARELLRRWLRSLAAGRDVLGEYRDRIMLPMASASALMLMPFAIQGLIGGRTLQGLFSAAVSVPLAVDALALWRGRKPPIAYGWILLPIAAAIGTALLEQGVYGAMWCYPAILFCYFVLPGWQATVGSVGLLVVTSGLVWRVLGGPTACRFTVTSGLSVIILNIILGVVGELQRKLYEQATTDPLTGALNRRQLADILSDAMEHSRRNDVPVSLLAFDLDHFKRINDRYGHATGDAVLQHVVALVQDRGRRIDRLFRMGGEEFALLLPGTHVADAMRVASMLRERIADAVLLPDAAQITVSVGVAQLHRKHTSDTWLKAADDALYRAKMDGRNCVRVASRGRSVTSSDSGDNSDLTRPSDLLPLVPSVRNASL
jgi:diguanylate cyclase (GGDEF)-like protein